MTATTSASRNWISSSCRLVITGYNFIELVAIKRWFDKDMILDRSLWCCLVFVTDLTKYDKGLVVLVVLRADKNLSLVMQIVVFMKHYNVEVLSCPLHQF